MSSNKPVADFIKICSILPTFVVLPVMAAENNPFFAEDNQMLSGDFSGYKNADNKNQGGVVTIGFSTTGVTVADTTIFSENENAAGTAGGAVMALNGFSTGKEVKFINNKVTSDLGGGALYVNLADKANASENTQVEIGTNNEFTGNNAQYGGAIALEYGKLVIGKDTDFTKNWAKKSADGLGGGAIAIWQNKTDRPNMHSVLTLNDVDFTENWADGDGGAIGVYDDGAKLMVNGGEFTGNHSDDGCGGAIFNHGGDLLIGSADNARLVTRFNANSSAEFGGAISTGYNDNGVGHGKAEIYNARFSGNTATSGGGAIANFGELSIDGVLFTGNRVTGEVASDDLDNRNSKTGVNGGGALFLDSSSSTYVAKVKRVTFSQNASSLNGGAIATRAEKSDSAVLDINDALFSRNNAQLDGGALFNTFEKATISNASFLDNVSYKGQGGAIYNAGTITMTGRNTFSGNIASKVSNDVYNVGTLIIAVGSDDSIPDITTFASGVSGNGTLTLQDGATMNIGVSKIEQGTLNLNGTIQATIVDGRSYGKLLATDAYNIGENARMELSVGQVGDYKMFQSGAAGLNDKIVLSDLFTHEILDDGTLRIATKSATDLAAAHNLSDRTAGMLVALANGGDRVLSVMSLRAQNALAQGDTAYMEAETEKTHPAEIPVVHSVAAAAQTQVMDLAAMRMDGTGVVGRNGGDMNAGYAVWGHGLYNKTKFNDRFSGTTDGIAIGADVSLNKKFMIGFGYADSSTDIDAQTRNIDVDGNTIFAYAQYKPGKWYANVIANYTMAEYEEYTNVYDVAFVSAYDVDSYGAQLMTGYDFAIGLTPEAGVRYLHVAQDDYNQFVGQVHSQDVNFVTGVAGLKYAFDIKSNTRAQWRPEMRAAAKYDFVSDEMMSTVVIPGMSYVVNGERLSRFGGEFGLGLTLHYDRLDVSLNYGLDLRKDYTSQTGMLQFRYAF